MVSLSAHLGCISLLFVITASIPWPLKTQPAQELAKAREPGAPHLFDLRRESVPVRRQGEIVSHKTTYSGVISVGAGADEPQEFRVVFDTGSGHVILPASDCQSESCLAHRRYNHTLSSSSLVINMDGTAVPAGEYSDQVKIGFGTGSVTGEFVRDTVCVGSHSAGGLQWENRVCVETHVVKAVEMSTTPFKNFAFDGIVGLGLDVLAISPEFSFFSMLTKGDKLAAPHFGVFLSDGESEEQSELAIGGHNPARLQQPLAWSPVSKPEHGHWTVQIIAVRVDGVELDFCKDGSCHGVMDTGTSHLGVPAPHDKTIAELVTRDAEGLDDCRHVRAPVLEIEIKGFNITLDPENYMRPLPLKAGLSVGSSKGVALPTAVVATTPAPSLVGANGQEVERYCRPRLMPVNLPAPVGPNLFIFGEPILQRYYTVFDWKRQSVGMGLSTSSLNKKHKRYVVGDEIIMLQVRISVRTRRAPEKRARVTQIL